MLFQAVQLPSHAGKFSDFKILVEPTTPRCHQWRSAHRKRRFVVFGFVALTALSVCHGMLLTWSHARKSSAVHLTEGAMNIATLGASGNIGSRLPSYFEERRDKYLVKDIDRLVSSPCQNGKSPGNRRNRHFR